MNNFDDLLKMLVDAHQDYQLLDDDERERDDDWIDETDTQVCPFKRRVYCWLRETVQKTKSAKSIVKFHVMTVIFHILLKGELSKGMDIMLSLCHFMIKSWFCQTASNKQLKDSWVLKKDFFRDYKFFLNCKKYMNNLLEKGYARRCNQTPTGKTCCFSHYAVYHLSKQGKISCV